MTTTTADVRARSVGVVEFDGVWLDDRRRCTWALCDVTFVAEPDSTTAVVAPPDEGAPEAILDLLCGRRLPVQGRVSIDGVDLRDLRATARLPALTSELALDRRERRVTVAGRTTLIAFPTAQTMAAADRVIAFDAGFKERDRLLVCAG